MTEADLATGQMWFPAERPGKRAKAREVVHVAEHLGTPHVFWSPLGHDDVSTIRVDGFTRWIRTHGATVEEAA